MQEQVEALYQTKLPPELQTAYLAARMPQIDAGAPAPQPLFKASVV